MITIKIKSVASLTGGFFLVIFLHYDMFGIRRLDTIKNTGQEDVANIARDLTTPLQSGPRVADMVLKNQDEMIVNEPWINTVHTTNMIVTKKPDKISHRI